MNKDLETTIQAYLSGQLTAEESQAFEVKMQEDVKLAREVQELQNLELGLESLGVDVFREDLKDWEADHQTPSKSTSISAKRIVAIAAAILLPIGAFIIFRLNAPASSGDLFAAHFKPYGNYQTVRDDVSVSAFDKGMLAYDRQDYDEAILQFEQHLADTKDDACIFYLGVSFISNARFEQGVDVLQEQYDHPLYGEAALWYAFLAYLKMEKYGKMRAIGERILEDGGHYKEGEVRSIMRSMSD